MNTEAMTHSQKRPVPRSRALRSLTAVAAVCVVGLTAAACGSSTPSATSNTTTTAVSPAGTTATAPPSTASLVADAVSNAKFGRPILVGATGKTLYKFSADSSTTSACNAGCATAWPPVTVPSGATPSGGPGTAGTFGTITRSDGTLQATYDGNPLYTFAGDTSAGDTNGQNLTSDGGTWTVVTVGTASPVSKSSPATTTTKPPSGGGYGY
jgi:predicted lipoprotein with Yx(FWY)xxD motif